MAEAKKSYKFISDSKRMKYNTLQAFALVKLLNCAKYIKDILDIIL